MEPRMEAPSPMSSTSWKTSIIAAAGGVLALVSVLLPWWSSSDGDELLLFDSSRFYGIWQTANGQLVSLIWSETSAGGNTYAPDQFWTVLFRLHILVALVVAAGILGIMGVKRRSATRAATALLAASVVLLALDLVYEV